MSATIAALVSDLIFSTKISSTARSLGAEVCIVGTVDQLAARLASHSDDLVLIDLDAPGLNLSRAIDICRQAAHRPRTVAFGSHVRSDLFAAARAAGADEIMARSAFVSKLPVILKTGGSVDSP